MTIQLKKPFRSNSAADEYDTRQIKHALNRLGYYTPSHKTGMSGIPDAGVFAALKAFQKEHGLPATGAAKPDDKTLQALNAALSTAPDGQYIWRTVGDDKVRGSHAALNGTLRRWSDSPDPTEDYNCRCWAETFKGLNLETLKEIPMGLQQELIASVGDAPRKWDTADFTLHFYLGGGESINLREIGYLGDVIAIARRDVFPKLEEQIADKMRRIKTGPLIYTTKQWYHFGEVHWVLGKGVLRTKTVGNVVQRGNILFLDATVEYVYSDEITDIVDVRNILAGSSTLADIPYDARKPWWNYKNMGGGLLWTLSDFGGTPYRINGDWTTKMKGSITVLK